MARSEHSIDGLLVLDKPAGWTSHDVVARVRRLTHERRVGHAGTLDPMATGVLVLGVGQGTRVLSYLGDSNKTYSARIRLGQTTTTYDREGEVTSNRAIDGIDEAAIERGLACFRGVFEQRPPLYSAIKLAGKPLYRYARAGVELEPAPRQVRVDSVELTSFEPPYLTLDLESSAGFYVRSLAHDLGQTLGCGAHLTDLRRKRAGPFDTNQARTLDVIEAAIASDRLEDVLWSLDVPLRRKPAVILGDEHTSDIVHGRSIDLRRAAEYEAEEICRAYAANGELIAVLRLNGVGSASPEKVFPDGRRGLNIDHE